MAILNPYSKTTYVDGTTPDLNAVNLNKNEQGVYDVTEKVRELAVYETNAAASAVSAASSASAAAASVAVYTDLVEDVATLTTDIANLEITKVNKTQSAWISPTLNSTWVNYANGYQTCQYMKDEFGVVHIRGVVKGWTSSYVIFVLPVGYRPALNEIFPSMQNGLFGTCTVFSNGNVVATGSGSGTSFCFGNISFVAV
jgi:hypothetical protein